jgi:hypothetical protein
MDWDWDDVWETMLDYWTVTLFLPTVLILLVVLAIITRVSDRE